MLKDAVSKQEQHLACLITILSVIFFGLEKKNKTKQNPPKQQQPKQNKKNLTEQLTVLEVFSCSV